MTVLPGRPRQSVPGQVNAFPRSADYDTVFHLPNADPRRSWSWTTTPANDPSRPTKTAQSIVPAGCRLVPLCRLPVPTGPVSRWGRQPLSYPRQGPETKSRRHPPSKRCVLNEDLSTGVGSRVRRTPETGPGPEDVVGLLPPPDTFPYTTKSPYRETSLPLSSR